MEKHIVSFPDELLDNEIVVQPNGIDLRVNKLWHLSGKARLPRDKKIETEHVVITEIPLKNGEFELRADYGQYLVDFRESASIKDGYCGIIVPRSSMLRTGHLVTSALWDTGFEGKLGATIRPLTPMAIEWGAAIAQIIIFQSEFNGHRYDGGYKFKDSQTAFH